MAGLVGPAIVEERGAGACGGFSEGVGVYSGGGTKDALVVRDESGSPTSSAACKSLA
jgi:hypothetical protein